MLYLLATPIGNISDITFRAIGILQSCDEILCEDTRIAKKLISLLNSRKMLQKSDYNFISLHSHNEDFRISELGVGFFKRNVVFMSDAGMPCISDPGAKLVKFMQENNLEYSIIPGVSSLLSAFALSGFELNNKNLIFHAFLPHKLQEKGRILNEILNNNSINVFFESTHRILETINLLDSIAPNNDIFVAKEITKIYEKFYFGKVGEVAKQIQKSNINGEWVIVIQSESREEKTLNANDISSMSLPPKIKAKLLSKLVNKSTESIYNEIIKGNI